MNTNVDDKDDEHLELEILKSILSENILSEPLISLKSDLLKNDSEKNTELIAKIDEIQGELKKSSPNINHIISLLDEVDYYS